LANTVITVDLSIGRAFAPKGNNDTLVGIENILASNASDSILGDANSNIIDGSGGNDTIAGFGGNDLLNGDDGLDSISGLSVVK
jgi:Ca2+-binding RTX toxin-like protein